MSWSHFIEIIHPRGPLPRQFYAEMARVERWSVRTLRKKIQSMFYERTAISCKPEELARQELEALQEEDRMTPRQKRMAIGNKDFYLDLFFYRCGLRRLVAIELKLGTFFAADALPGQASSLCY